jgi:hypothetical protein
MLDTVDCPQGENLTCLGSLMSLGGLGVFEKDDGTTDVFASQALSFFDSLE